MPSILDIEPMRTCTADAEEDAGGDPMSSLADEPQLAQVHAAIAEGYAGDDARRRELLDWLDAHGFGSTPFRSIPTDVLARARRELGHPAPGAPAPPVGATLRTSHFATCPNAAQHRRRRG